MFDVVIVDAKPGANSSSGPLYESHFFFIQHGGHRWCNLLYFVSTNCLSVHSSLILVILSAIGDYLSFPNFLISSPICFASYFRETLQTSSCFFVFLSVSKFIIFPLSSNRSSTDRWRSILISFTPYLCDIFSGAKKGKKKKGKTVSLNDFLTTDGGSSNAATPIGSSYVLAPRKVDWADEAEDIHVSEGESVCV